MIDRQWMTGNAIGKVYVLAEGDLQRVGHCWMNGRLLLGDVAMCIRHSGDAFFDYILLDIGSNYVKGIPGSKFGSYSLSTEDEWMPTDKEFHLLAAGESIGRTVPRNQR